MRVDASRSECVLSSAGHGLRYVPLRQHIGADVGSAERTWLRRKEAMNSFCISGNSSAGPIHTSDGL